MKMRFGVILKSTGILLLQIFFTLLLALVLLPAPTLALYKVTGNAPPQWLLATINYVAYGLGLTGAVLMVALLGVLLSALWKPHQNCFK